MQRRRGGQQASEGDARNQGCQHGHFPRTHPWLLPFHHRNSGRNTIPRQYDLLAFSTR
jgi:hypothetical protein